MTGILALARSAGWIAAIQAVNFLIPLAAVPFLVRGLGVEEFSAYAVLMACVGFFVIFSDFSFNVTGPLRVRAAEGRLGELILDSLLVKAGLMLPAAVVLVAVGAHAADAGDALLALALGIATSLTPRWVAYSLGRLRGFALVSGLCRGAWLGAVILGASSDLTLVLGASLAAQLAAMAGTFALVWPGGRRAPSLRRAADVLRQDIGQFGAILAGAGTRELNLVILAAFAAAPEVAAFALADRVRVLMVGLVAPVTQALYLAIVGGRDAGLRGPASLFVLLAATAGGATVFLLADPIARVLGGGALPGAAPILRILCLLPFLSGLTAILGTNTLLAEGRRDAYAAGQFAVAIAGIPLSILAISRGGAEGAAWAAVALEAMLALLYAIALRRAGLLARLR